ncbi:hypothetical protein M407DRAFT_20304 [Tulasnella calospora MUT 4182]|uniref:Protein kinase domain-containing protein n=1 Tax=Tulasnella calospora MUT 4182 TaxID=1051891 RepID=A0A0C3QRU3_9AGAM|nr:hypothetical protein M407DRAFT_20304 [Tulasnella calospora MUT 4182]
MTYLHSLSPPICHGDLKPGNVLVTDSQDAVLCDFGIASLIQDSEIPSGFTTSRSIKGSSRYMGPELLLEDEPKRSLANDVWSWACTVFEIIADTWPYAKCKSDAAIIHAMVNGEAPVSEERLQLGFSTWETDAAPRSFVLYLQQALRDCWEFDPTMRPSLSDVWPLGNGNSNAATAGLNGRAYESQNGRGGRMRSLHKEEEYNQQTVTTRGDGGRWAPPSRQGTMMSDMNHHHQHHGYHHASAAELFTADLNQFSSYRDPYGQPSSSYAAAGSDTTHHHPHASNPSSALPVIAYDVTDADETCPVCLESLAFSFRLPGERPHVVPECGHVLHHACFAAVYGPLPRTNSAGGPRKSNIGICGVCRRPMKVGDSDGEKGEYNQQTVTTPSGGGRWAPPSRQGTMMSDMDHHPAHHHEQDDHQHHGYHHAAASKKQTPVMRDMDVPNPAFASVAQDLQNRIADWKGHPMSHLGALQMFDILSVRRDVLVKEFYVYLFETAIICVSEYDKKNTNSLSRLLRPFGKGASSSVPATANKSLLKLKGRIYITHIRKVHDTSIPSELSLTLDMEKERLESFSLIFRDRTTLEEWRAVILGLVDQVRGGGALGDSNVLGRYRIWERFNGRLTTNAGGGGAPGDSNAIGRAI